MTALRWVGLALFLAGPAWMAWANWLRHRPHRLTEGTQGLALLGALGGVFFMAAGVACVAASLPAAR